MPKGRKIILLIETSRSWSRGLLRGIAKYSHMHAPWHHYRLGEFYWKPGHKSKKSELAMLKDWGVEGIITREMHIIDDLLTLNIPIIGSDVDPMPDNISYISENFAETGRMAAEHMLDKGFRHFAFCGFSDMPWSIRRRKSFCDRINKAGFEVSLYEKPMSKLRRLWKNETSVMANWVKSLPVPIGIMACSDGRSQHLIEACKIANLHVPEKLAVLGVDNDNVICELSTPTLSSISFNTERAGYEAAKLLDEMMDNNNAAYHKIIVHPTHVVTRQSTDILAIDDEMVVAALRYIREHTREVMQVTDVVKHIGCSRRSLEQRFKKILGRSVLNEIKRVRVAEIATMLVETNASLKRITLALGHYSIDNITRYFKQQMGMSPTEYRKQYGRK